MSNINDKATVSLFVNGEQAEDAMDRLRKKAQDLDKQLQTAMAAGDKKSANKLQRELDRVTKELNKTESAAKGTGVVLNNLADSSIHGLQNALKYLQRELNNTRPGTEAWKTLAGRINEVKSRIQDLNGELEGSKSHWAKFKEWALSAWPAIDLLNQWGSNIFDVMRGAVDAFATMDQDMANVRKFTGMTADQVAYMNEEFKKIDTRTSREDLNKLAQEAGRLGKSAKEDVLGFVRAADQINVALDDLGEGATLTLSKLTGVFGDEARYGTEQSLLKVGSVINELSQNCSASAPYLAQFASRMGGVGAQAKMTIPQIMAFGAVLDSNGQAVEASSTALSQVIVRMMQEPAKYAKVAGLDVKKFSDMLKTDVNGALIMFLETLQKAGGMDTLSPMFADMGENGARVIAALSTLATHIDQVKQQQQVATEAFAEGTSVTKEFGVQNTTVQASIEKAKKAFNDLRVELGQRLSPLMTHMISSSSAIIRGLLTLVSFLMDNKNAIISLAAGIAAYNIVLHIAAIRTAALAAASKYLNIISAALRLSFIAGSGAVALFTGNITKATAAFKLFSRAIKTNPIGLAVSLITTAVVAIGGWIKKVYDAREAEKELARQRAQQAREFRAQVLDISQASADYAKNELDRLKKLYAATQDQTKSQKERIAAVEELQKTYPTAFSNLSQEQILAGNAASAYDNLAENIIKAARAKAAAEKLKDNEKQLLDLNFEREDVENSIREDASARDNAIAYRKRINRQISSKRKFSLSGPTARERRQMDAASSVVQKLSDNLDVSAERLEEIIMKTGELEKANSRLAKIAGDPSKIAPDINLSSPDIANPPLNPNPDKPDPDTPKPERFAEEKAWREHEEAEARIHYAKGEATYSQHMARMAEIETKYYQKLRDRADVEGEERHQIDASYYEAERKQKQAASKLTLEEEDRRYQDLLDRLRSNHQKRLNQEDMSAQARQREAEYYAEVTELAELQHLQKVVGIYKVGSDEYLEAQRRFQQKEISAQERHLKSMERQQQEYANIKKTVFGMNQNEKDAEFARQFDALTTVYNQELAAVGDNELEKLRIKKAYMDAELALRKEYNQAGAEDTKSAYASAIEASAKWLQGDGGKAITGTISTLTSGMSAIFSGLSQMVQAELEIQTAKIEKRYDREIEYAQGNSYKVAKIEKQKEKELAKAKNEANKKMFAMQVIQAVAQTAQNAISAYGSAAAIPVVGYVLAPIAAAMAVAAGAIQIAAIKKQQQASEAQGYSKGGFTKPGAVDEPAGIVHAGEWVASQKLLANPVARPMIEALDLAQRTNTIGSLKPDDVSRSIRANDLLARIADDDNQGALIVAAFAQNSQAVGALVERLNEPIVTVNTVTGDHGIKQAQDEYSRLMNNVTPKSKRKK